MEVWSRKRLPFCIPLSARSRLRGLAGARRQLALLLRLHRPRGLRFPLEFLRKVQRRDFSGASANAELRPGEPGPSLSFAQV